MNRVLIFGGTSEGREIAEYFANTDITIIYSAATEYGASIVKEADNIIIHNGRLDEEEMKNFLQEYKPVLCVDATHPYAVVVSENIRKACTSLNFEYIRVVRKTSSNNDLMNSSNVYEVNDVKEAAFVLSKQEGNILVTTGSKELEEYTVISDYNKRCYVRVLPTEEVLLKCSELGFCGDNLIGAKGPFSKDDNVKMLQKSSAKWLVTKNSGTAGGFYEKCEAAKELDVSMVIIKRPDENNTVKQLDVDGTIKYILDSILDKKIYIIGMGPGNENLVTKEAADAINECSLLIGASRMLDIAGKLCDMTSKNTFVNYKENEIYEYIVSSKDKKIAILYSGDVTFYSGAIKMLDKLSGMNVSVINGLSSMDYFLEKIGVDRSKVVVTSCHGNDNDICPYVLKGQSVAALLGGKNQVAEISKKIMEYYMSGCNADEITTDDKVELIDRLDRIFEVYVGSNLSYPNEKIEHGKLSDFVNYKAEMLSIIYIKTVGAK